MEDIKKSIKEYYIRFVKAHKEKGIIPKVPHDPRVSPEMYVGSEDEEGYISWKLTERSNLIIREVLSIEIGFDIHRSLFEFLNSYYFLEMSGKYGDYELAFDCIVPNTIVKNYIQRRYIALETNEEKIDLIQIGVIYQGNNDNLKMCFVNDTGQIASYDYDKGNIEVISNSLDELLRNMEARC